MRDNERVVIAGPFADSRISSTNEWLTPREIVETLGPFDLDPCSPPPERRPWSTASLHYDESHDGLSQPWRGLVWCNPPYGKHTAEWLAKCAAHGSAVALVFSRTDTAWFHDHVAPSASALLFWRRRINFCLSTTGEPSKTPAAPSMLIAYGDEALSRLRRVESRGALVVLRQSRQDPCAA